MSLYSWFLFFLCCTRGWYRSFWGFSKGLKVANPGDMIVVTTTLKVILPEKNPTVVIECGNCETEVKK